MRIYLFRGLFGGIFSSGIDKLAEKLSSMGHKTSVHRWMERPLIESEVLANKDSSKGEVFALIGHSLGGNSANYMGNNLSDAGLNVAYVATIDPTGPRDAPDGAVSDNFRSSDIRDKPVKGANEFNFPDLDHIQIDKDERVHNQILARCGTADQIFKASTTDEGASQMTEDETRASGVSQIDGHPASNDDLTKILAALIAVLGGRNITTSADNLPTPPPPEDQEKLTPINGWLGKSIGKLLNGKKTGLGILGLLSVYVLPTLFPQLAPIQAIFKSLGATSEQLVGDNIETGKNILTPIFTALGGWGIFGKIEKWIKRN